MKYDITKFEHLHFLIQQIEKAGASWGIGSLPFTAEQIIDAEKQNHKYFCEISIIQDNHDNDYHASADCPIDALALAYQKFKEIQDDRNKVPEPLGDSRPD